MPPCSWPTGLRKGGRMKRAHSPRTGMPLARTMCNGCGKTFPGRVLPADRAYCPSCESKCDPESKRAMFAPGRGGRVPNLGTDVPEDEA